MKTSPLILGSLALPVAWLALSFASGCSDDTSGTGGGGGTTTTSTSTSTSTAAGGGGAGQGGQGGHGGAAGCHGDQAAWDAIEKANITCQKSSDCCVVVNGCTNEAQVVGAGDFDAAQTAWPYCDNDCTDCIPPDVVVECSGGKCVGYIAPEGDGGIGVGTSHCGEDGPSLGLSGPKLAFTCGG